ncbi:MAG: ribose ABC transporter permease [Prevotellaceae bacterium]|jgi:ribose transport system permease protein|nr:ribose ABC transporter permease [Prevotellaceae bacterium]
MKRILPSTRLLPVNLSVLRPLAALLLMILGMTFLSDNFATTDNLFNVLRQVSVNLCISVGMTLVILTGGIDLSVGSMLALSGAVAAGLIRNGVALAGADLFIGFTFLGCVLASLLVGALLGFFNGLMVTRFKVPPFVATLAMLTIARGLTMLYTGGYPITGLGEDFTYLGTGWFWGMPMPVWVAVVIIVLFLFFIRKSKTGRYIYAIGGNERATRLSGVDINKVKLVVYTLTGVLCAVAGLLVTARLDSAQPNAGSGYELDSIAAVVIGGTSLSGGKGTIIGTVIGALIIGVLNNGLVLLDVSPFWQQVIKGLVILGAVILDRMNEKSAA